MSFKLMRFYFILTILFFAACKKTTITQNTLIPSYTEVPTVLVENYINRIYIDLLGREPLNVEMDNEVSYLRSNELTFASRKSLVNRLQTDTTFREGEISYKHAYYHQIYDKSKARMIEGASEYEIQFAIDQLNRPIYDDSMAGNFEQMMIKKHEQEKLRDILYAEALYMNDSISLGTMLGAMANNKIYDIINMNTFNFIQASFDNLFFRFPTDHEFYTCFDIVEYNQSGLLWGKSAQNKEEIINLWINSQEFLNGQVVWLYQSLLARDPNSQEMAYGIKSLYENDDIQKLEREIIATDEYAHFTYINK
jgi:hypothetical protein